MLSGRMLSVSPTQQHPLAGSAWTISFTAYTSHCPCSGTSFLQSQAIAGGMSRPEESWTQIRSHARSVSWASAVITMISTRWHCLFTLSSRSRTPAGSGVWMQTSVLTEPLPLYCRPAPQVDPTYHHRPHLLPQTLWLSTDPAHHPHRVHHAETPSTAHKNCSALFTYSPVTFSPPILCLRGW